VLSRIAEDLFWLGRYIERAENVARFVDVHYHARLEQGGGPELGWEPIVAVSREGALFAERYGAYTEANVLAFLTTDPACPNSILACLRHARDNARGAREYVSVEMWEELNKAYLFVQRQGRGAITSGEPHGFFADIKMRAYLLFGVADATLLHDEGWQFLRAGAFLERVVQTARLLALQAHFLAPQPADAEPHHWIALLKSCSAYEAYRRTFAATFAPDRAVALLLLHRGFPRSVYFSAAEVAAALTAIAEDAPAAPAGRGRRGGGVYRTQAEREAARLCNRLAVATTEDVWAEGLQDYLEGVIASAHAIGEAMGHDFFLVEAERFA
jgi:uncharacterized alpha-E superfamily protein